MRLTRRINRNRRALFPEGIKALSPDGQVVLLCVLQDGIYHRPGDKSWTAMGIYDAPDTGCSGSAGMIYRLE